MAKAQCILWLLAISVVGTALTPSSFLTTVDQNRLRSVFELAQPYGKDVANTHYSILGLKLLGVEAPKDTCASLNSGVDKQNLASLYHASSASKALSGCKLEVGNVQQLLSDAIKEDAAVADIFYAFFALKNLGLAVDNAKVSKSLAEALKKDDSPLSFAYAFQVATELTGDVNNFFESIEDVVAQADEVDERYLQFEGGIYVTSFVVNSAYLLAEKLKKAPTISPDKVVKFANYFLSRKHVHQLRSAYYFLAAVKILTDNKFHVPVAVTLASPVAVSQASQNIQVRVTDLMGGSLGQLTVTADSARHLGDEAIVLSKKPFTPVAGDSSLYELSFMQTKPLRGFYRITVSVNPTKADKRLIGTTGAEVEVKVTTQVAIENVEIGVVDKDQTTATRTTKLVHPNKAASVLEADYHQKIIMKFQLKDKTTGQLLTAHQTFVRLTNQQSGQEIIFVAEADSSNTNKFDLDVGSRAKEFGHLSGKYSMELIVGDAVIENPFSWNLAEVKLTFPEGATPAKESISQYSKKPEIKHMFRPQEKLPPTAVSMAFTAMVLSPFLLLLILWLKIGINVSNFPMTISALGFHICLSLIFGLYYCYWTNLNMFQTLRYLGILAVPTFLFGNRLLSGLASRRKKA